MLDKIILYSVRNKLITGLFLLLFIGFGLYSVSRLSIDALPDVTSNQVLVVTTCPNLATQEVEQFITLPIETQLKSIPGVNEIRSSSRSGLSSITVVFEDHIPLNITRQQVAERLKLAEDEIPKGLGTPIMVPPTTGLGEIYQYSIHPRKGYESKYSPMELRTIQDWIIRKQLLGVPGVIDVSTIGGYLKQYEVAVLPEKLVSMNISLIDVFNALSKNNQNTGGSYIEKAENIYFIRGEGILKNITDIENVVVKNVNGIPIKIHDISTVQFGHAPRFGAMTRNAEGETVGAVVLMLKGENTVKVIEAVKERMELIKKNLPEGLNIDTFLDRSELIGRTIGTVSKNLIEGALIVIFILILFLGNFRAGLIVASVIPLSMLFAIMIMNMFGITANLMSMGALDFGLIVDGAVIIVESILHRLSKNGWQAGFDNSQQGIDNEKYSLKQETSALSLDNVVIQSSTGIISSAVFGQIIILIVYLPIFALVGIEGKMFTPMAQTVSFSIIGALILSLTYVPLMSSIFLTQNNSQNKNISERFIRRLQKWYTPIIVKVLNNRIKVLLVSASIFIASIFLFKNMGGEFLPEMDEGDFQVNFSMRQGTNLSEMIITSNELEKILLDSFSEVKQVVAKIGTSEVPTDPMPFHFADLNIILEKDKSKWTSAKNKEELAEKMEEALNVIPGKYLVFEQPIQMRVNEMIAGVKSDIAIKIFGDNLEMLATKGQDASKLISSVNGVVDTKVEQTIGMPQLLVKYNRDRIAQYGLNIEDCNTILNTALAGGKAGYIYEGEKKFDLRVRLANYRDADEDKVKNIYIPLNNGLQIPLSQIADISFQSAPTQISRENANRRIVIECNVKDRDIESTVKEIQSKLDAKLNLPSGYFLSYGGTFENLQEAKARLKIATPAALLLIFLLLFFSFRNIAQSLIIYSAIPLAAIGGIIALWLRGMNFSISAGIGFIALFGVAVLNGIVLIAYFNRLEEEGEENILNRIIRGTTTRLRPVLATAAVASLGFLPMALSTSAGSEVQKPLATVVIGGLISSTLLTLIVLPVLYSLFTKMKNNLVSKSFNARNTITIALLLIYNLIPTQSFEQITVSLKECIQIALKNHPNIQSATLAIEQQIQLKKTNLTLDPINLAYQGGQINSNVNDYSFTASTGISFPTTISAQTKFQNQRILLAESQANISKTELIRNVSTSFYQLLFTQQKSKLLIQLDSVYSNFSKFANTKFNVGESNLLEKLTAEAKLKEIQLQKHQNESDIKIYKNKLQQWTGSNIDLLIDEKSNSSVPIIILDSLQLNSNAFLQYQEQQIKVSYSLLDLEKSKYAPSLQFGYFMQSLDRVNTFFGYHFGLNIPLLKTGQKGRINAAMLQTQIEKQNLSALKLHLNTEFVTALEDYKKQNASVNYYQKDGIPLSERLILTASKSYQSGDISYIEYIQTLSQAYIIKNEYLQTLYNLNQASVNLNFLLMNKI